MGAKRRMLYDLLNNWPLALASFWMFVLFFAGKFVHLGQLGLCGRGVPVTSSRTRWAGAIGRGFSAASIAIGVTLIGGLADWLFHAIYVRFPG